VISKFRSGQAPIVDRARSRALLVELIQRLVRQDTVPSLVAAVRAATVLCKIDGAFDTSVASGSGSAPFRSRCVRLDVRAMLRPPDRARRLAFGGGMVLAEIVPDEALKVSYEGVLSRFSPQLFRLESRPCGGFGGARPPADRLVAVCSCGRRAFVFYGVPGNAVFGCRVCVPVAYDSRRTTAANRAAARASRLRRELGGSGALAEPIPGPPWAKNGRRMRRERYDRIVKRITADEQCFFGAVEKTLTDCARETAVSSHHPDAG
jgi:hypothetical protein